jgi:hypothetical protein
MAGCPAGAVTGWVMTGSAGVVGAATGLGRSMTVCVLARGAGAVCVWVWCTTTTLAGLVAMW